MAKVTLVACDELRVETTSKVCNMSKLLSELIEEQEGECEIPVANVRGHALKAIVEYMTHHCGNRAPELEKPLKRSLSEVLSTWDRDFLRVHGDQTTVFELIRGANFLNIRDLLELCCAYLAEMMKSKSVEDIRDMFGLENDFTEEEEEKLRREHNIEN